MWIRIFAKTSEVDIAQSLRRIYPARGAMLGAILRDHIRALQRWQSNLPKKPLCMSNRDARKKTRTRLQELKRYVKAVMSSVSPEDVTFAGAGWI